MEKNKMSYLEPKVKVVKFQVESGFAATEPVPTTTGHNNQYEEVSASDGEGSTWGTFN